MSFMFRPTKPLVMTGQLDLTAGTWKAMLIQDSYAPDPEQEFVSDLVAHEVSVDNYARQTLGTRSMASDTELHTETLNVANVTFAGLGNGQTAIGVVVFLQGSGDSDSRLIGYYELGGGSTALDGDLVVPWAGLVRA